MEQLTIGKVARQAGLGVETIRFYERQELLDPPPRNKSNYRQYPESIIKRLHFIRRAKKLGFSLKEIKELLDLQDDPLSTCGDFKLRADQKLVDVTRRIHDLEKIRNALLVLLSGCPSNVTSDECPILQAIIDG